MITISGTVLEYNEKTEITDVVDMTITGSATLPEPVILSSAELSSAEDYECVLAALQNVTVSNDSLGYGNWEVEDQSGICIIGGLGNYTYEPVTNELIYNLTGVVDYTYGSFKLEPRDDADIDLIGSEIDEQLISVGNPQLSN